MAGESGLTIEQRFELVEDENRKLQLQEERPGQVRQEIIQTLQTLSPKIQRVAYYLRDREDLAKHYSPKLVSFGPIHHGEAKLQAGEWYKLMWLAMYVKSTGQTERDLYKRIADNIKGLKDLFDKDLFNQDEFNNYKSQGFKDLDEKLSWMLFVDGCSLLQILDKGDLGEQYAYHKLNLKMDQLILVQQDTLLLENQLPYPVLRLLSCHENPDVNLLGVMEKFLRTHHLWPEPCHKSEGTNGKKKDNLQREITVVVRPPPIHLLDHLRSTILVDCGPEKDRNMSESRVDRKKSESDAVVEITHRNIQELRASGIKLKKICSRRPKDIKFSAGELTLPDIIVDDTTAPTFLNLIAHEMCPDFQNDYGISSFVAFLDSLIDHPEDVKHLRKKRILRNALGSDEDVSTLFNTISADLVTSVGSYSEVTKAIEIHYRDKGNAWMYQAWSTYFSSPWSIIALFAAIFALVLTFIQTWYSVKGTQGTQK